MTCPRHIYLLVFKDKDENLELMQVFCRKEDAYKRKDHLNQFATVEGAEYLVMKEDVE